MTIPLFSDASLHRVILKAASEAWDMRWTKCAATPNGEYPKHLYETHYDHSSVMVNFDDEKEIEVFLMNRQGVFIYQGKTTPDVPNEVRRASGFLRYVISGIASKDYTPPAVRELQPA
jgi:hypothetical protein